VLVICPRKTVERDRVEEAHEKGIDAIAGNEDTEKTPELWKRLRTFTRMIFISPEMALFNGLTAQSAADSGSCYRRGSLCRRVGRGCIPTVVSQAVYVSRLYGLYVPYLACTATCTFDLRGLGGRHGPEQGLGIYIPKKAFSEFTHVYIHLRHVAARVLYQNPSCRLAASAFQKSELG